MGAGEAFKHLYKLELTGDLAEDGKAFLESLGAEDVPEFMTLHDVDWISMPLGVTEDGAAILDLGPAAYDILTSVGFSLFYVDEESDMMLLLGTDNDIDADWENGIFYDNFRGVWGAIDGCLVYMELSLEG